MISSQQEALAVQIFVKMLKQLSTGDAVVTSGLGQNVTVVVDDLFLSIFNVRQDAGLPNSTIRYNKGNIYDHYIWR